MAAALVTVLLQVAALQAGPFTQVLSPGTSYDPAIPTLEQVVGHDFHEEITPPDEIAAYLAALAEAAPERARLVEYARSYEGRPLHVLVIGSAERMARLDAIKEDLRRLSSPAALSAAEAERLVAELPVVTALLHGVHGNEISSAGAAMAEAYHLLAARNDPRADLILRESLVLIDPAQNPDGRFRFTSHYAQSRAFPPDPDPLAAEHDEPWPGGRTSHYLFDLNRDWFAHTHPESRGRVAMLLEYMPHVVVDLHEMGGNSTYYFPPAAPPGNPHMTAAQMAAMDDFGRATAGAFDARGFPYFTREIYDSYYPGYGVSWPTAHGALGMTFEQASARGLVIRRSDDTLLTYGDGILHHFTAALSTAETAARNRERLLRDYLAFRRGPAEGLRGAPAAYVFDSPHDPGMAERLARTLAANGVEVGRAQVGVRAGGRTFDAGAYVVPMPQGAWALARNLLDPETEMDSAFVALQRERRAQRLRDQIYDVTAWSLPLLWDVELALAERPVGVRTTPVAAEAPAPAGAALDPGAVAYLIPWGAAGAPVVSAALGDGLRVHAAGGAFTLDGRRFPVGTAIVRRTGNPDDVGRRLATLAAAHGAEVVPIHSTYVTDGMSLGSGRVRALRTPRVLLVWDRPGSSYSAGWARWVLEQRYGVSPTPVRASSLGRAELADYDVIVLPSGSYSSELGASELDRLRAWIRAGGTLVTMAESSRWAARESVGLLGTVTEARGGAPEGAPRGERTPPAPEQPIDLLEAIAPRQEAPEQTPGAILRVLLDEEHWLSAGTDGEIGALVEGTRIFTPITLDRGQNVGVYAPMERLVMSGIVWESARPQLASKAFLIHQPMGGGQIVAFAEDPNYRGYAAATSLLFANAVLLGPGR